MQNVFSEAHPHRVRAPKSYPTNPGRFQNTHTQGGSEGRLSSSDVLFTTHTLDECLDMKDTMLKYQLQNEVPAAAMGTSFAILVQDPIWSNCPKTDFLKVGRTGKLSNKPFVDLLWVTNREEPPRCLWLEPCRIHQFMFLVCCECGKDLVNKQVTIIPYISMSYKLDAFVMP